MGEAIALGDQGKNKEAAAQLRAESEKLRELGEKYKMDDVVREAGAWAAVSQKEPEGI